MVKDRPLRAVRIQKEALHAQGKQVIITSSSGNEISHEMSDGSGGVFTVVLVEGLKGAADEDGDGWIESGELYEYVKEQVSKLSQNQQHPVMKGKKDIKLVADISEKIEKLKMELFKAYDAGEISELAFKNVKALIEGKSCEGEGVKDLKEAIDEYLMGKITLKMLILVIKPYGEKIKCQGVENDISGKIEKLKIELFKAYDAGEISELAFKNVKALIEGKSCEGEVVKDLKEAIDGYLARKITLKMLILVIKPYGDKITCQGVKKEKAEKEKKPKEKEQVHSSANVVVEWGERKTDIYKLELPFIVEGIDVGDWDNDGVDEIFIGTNKKELLIAKFDLITSKLTIEASASFPEVPHSIVYNDVDKDGTKEFIVGTGDGDSGGYLYVGTIDSTGWHQEWKSGYIGSIRLPTEISVGDEDGNGRKEIALGVSFYGRKLVVYEYNGIAYDEKWHDNIGSDTDSVYYYDLDDDGEDELIVGTSHWSDWAFRIYDDGNLVKRIGGDNSRNLVCGANLRGLGNVAVRGRGVHATGSGKIGIEIYKKSNNDYEMVAEYKKDTLDGAHTLVAPGAADLDRDGYDEIVYYLSYYPPDPHPDNSELGILKYNGESLEPIKSYELELNHVVFNTVKIGDVDGDGKLEIIVPSYFDKANTATPVLNIVKPF